MTRNPGRRRFLTVAAAAAAALPLGGIGENTVRWQGTALGADAEMRFAAASQAEALDAVTLCRNEITRLERIFSLYDRHSEVTRLNETGAIRQPSADLVAVVELARWFARRTGGAFDCTMQPLWRCLADHFSSEGRDTPPDPGAIARAIARVGHTSLSVAPGEIRLATGAAISLNGIAQGYITDRVADLLQARGWRDVLVSLGEIRALPGKRWPVRLAASRTPVALSDEALATSAGTGTRFDESGLWHHLIDPRSGRSPNHFETVTVKARRAVVADALSTALAVAAPEEIGAIAKRFPATTIILQHRDGDVETLQGSA